MAKGKLTGIPFEKGNRANPLGAGAHDPVVRANKRFLSEALKHDLINDPEYVEDFISALKKNAKRDKRWAEMMLDRLEGKPIQGIEVENITPYAHLTDEEVKLKLIEEAKKINAAQ